MKVAVIGGGAAGLMAACSLARGGATVTLLEKQPRVGKKLLATGNGRCNFTNINARPEHYHGAREAISAVLAAYPPEAILAEFERMGIPARTDSEGRVYPASNAASSVLDALRLTLSEAGGAQITGFEVISIEITKSGFTVRARDGGTVSCDKLLLATGGPAAPQLGGCTDGQALLKTLGHAVTKLAPAITPLKTDAEPIRGLKGQRVRCTVTLLDGDSPVRTEAGEVLFTEYGLSGICVMQLARDAQALKNPRVKLDFAPGAEPEMIQERARILPDRALEDFLNGLLPRRVGWSVLKQAGISDLARKTGSLKPGELQAISRALRGFRLTVTGVCGFDAAQVTAGGADMRAFHPATLESHKLPGLYIAGELCDVDGDCGGFNLHWAWASGLAAARAILGGAI